ncbi:MAG: hypothetical protein ACLQJ0_22915, partial [Steroidobacteraceae bacterium]
DHVTPHILTRKTRLRPRTFLINDAKGLLQQYRPEADSCTATNAAQGYNDLLDQFASSDKESQRLTVNSGFALLTKPSA